MVIERRDLHYPDLQSCHVVLSGTPLGGGSRTSTGSGGGGGPVSLPREALDALTPIPPPHDFGLGKLNRGTKSCPLHCLHLSLMGGSVAIPLSWLISGLRNGIKQNETAKMLMSEA